jgi:hypothetical protein
MSLEDLGNIGEFVAAIAVVASLVYLAVQIRQNTRQVNANTLDQATQSFSRFRDPMIRDRALAELFTIGLRDVDALDGPDRLRFRHLLMDLFLGYLSLYLRSEDSAVSRDMWVANIPGLRVLLSQPGVAAWWDSIHDTCGYNASFVAQVDAIRGSTSAGADEVANHFLQKQPPGAS